MWPAGKAWGDAKPLRSHWPPLAPTRAHLTCENSLRCGEHLFQALWRHPPQSDPGVLTAYRGCRLITAGPTLPEPRDPPSGPAPYPQQGGGGQRGPRQGRSRLCHSAAWAVLCQAGGRASAAVGGAPIPRPISNRQGCRVSSPCPLQLMPHHWVAQALCLSHLVL